MKNVLCVLFLKKVIVMYYILSFLVPHKEEKNYMYLRKHFEL